MSIANRPSKVTIPKTANPLAKLVFAEMARQRVTYFDLEWKAGVLVSTIKAWRGDNRPGLETLEACLGALGWALVPVPRYDRLPDGIREKLDELAAEWGRDEPILHQLLAACCQVPVLNTKPVPARHSSGREPKSGRGHPFRKRIKLGKNAPGGRKRIDIAVDGPLNLSFRTGVHRYEFLAKLTGLDRSDVEKLDRQALASLRTEMRNANAHYARLAFQFSVAANEAGELLETESLAA